MSFKRIAIAGLSAFALAVVGVAGGAGAAEPVKVGFVYVGPIGDHGWTYRHDQGRLAVERAFGDKVKTTFVESVKEGADAERVIQQLAATGHALIFTTSFGFMNPTLKVAKRFPNVRFEHATGYKRSKNVSTYMARFYEGRTIAGIIAGHMSKTNVVGYIASFPIPEVVRGINAFTLAMRRINPEAKVKVVWVNTWYDPGKEAEAAKALIDQGADIILQHTDSPAPLQIAEKRGKLAVGQASDMTKFGANAHLTAIVDVWDNYYVARTKAVIDGTWSSKDTWDGLDAGMLAMAPFNPVIPDNVAAEARQAIDDIKAGRLHPFAGPVNNQAGEMVVPAGEVVGDDKLLSMNWYVEGVQGKLPQ